jgi:hypothetical protein
MPRAARWILVFFVLAVFVSTLVSISSAATSSEGVVIVNDGPSPTVGSCAAASGARFPAENPGEDGTKDWSGWCSGAPDWCQD